MKKMKKILSIFLPILLFNLKLYAVEESIIENLTGSVKFIGIGIAVVIIGFIIFFGYILDKKAEERKNNNGEKVYDGYEAYKIAQEVPEEDFSTDYQETSLTKEENNYETISSFDEENYENTSSNDEEESLYNSVNEYVEEREYNEDEILEEIEIEKDDQFNVSFNVDEEENDLVEDYEEEEEIPAFTFDTASEENYEEIEPIQNKEEISPIEYENDNSESEIIEEYDNEVIEEEFEQKEPIINEVEEDFIEQNPIKTIESKVKKYTGKKIGKKVNIEPVVNSELDFEDTIEYDEEDDEDIGVPTFDELLKQSEEDFSNSEEFDFMTQMEENLKKNKEDRLGKGKTKIEKKTTTKKMEDGTVVKKTSVKKTTTKTTKRKKKTE